MTAPTTAGHHASRAHATQRALDALGGQWSTSATRSRLLLIGCLRQGLRLAHDHRLELGWLADAAWSYISGACPPPTPEGLRPGPARGMPLDSGLYQGQHRRQPLPAAAGATRRMGARSLHQHSHDSAAARRTFQVSTAEPTPRPVSQSVERCQQQTLKKRRRPYAARRLVTAGLHCRS